MKWLNTKQKAVLDARIKELLEKNPQGLTIKEMAVLLDAHHNHVRGRVASMGRFDRIAKKPSMPGKHMLYFSEEKHARESGLSDEYPEVKAQASMIQTTNYWLSRSWQHGL